MKRRTSSAALDAKKVQALTEARFMSWAELALRSDISASTISLLMAGKRNASYKTIRRLAAALDVEPAEIIAK